MIGGKTNRHLGFRWDEADDFTALLGGSTENGVLIRAWSEVLEIDPEMLQASSERYLDMMLSSDLRNLTYQNLRPETLALDSRADDPG